MVTVLGNRSGVVLCLTVPDSGLNSSHSESPTGVVFGE